MATVFSYTDTYQDYFNKPSILAIDSKIKTNLTDDNFVYAGAPTDTDRDTNTNTDTDTNGTAHGYGAVRQYIGNIIGSLLDSEILLVNGFFMYFNPEMHFFKNSEKMIKLAHLVSLNAHCEGTLPYHLSPRVLEIICGPMNQGVIEYFFDKMQPSLSHILSKDYTHIWRDDMEYDTFEAYLRDNMLVNFTYLELLFGTCLKELLTCPNHIELDIKFSGEYNISHTMVLRCMKMKSSMSPRQQGLWTAFIKGLSQSELIDLLMYFTNSKSCENEITITVDPSPKVDVNISTCGKIVSIAERLFTNLETLSALKALFANYQNIKQNSDIIDAPLRPQFRPQIRPQIRPEIRPQNTTSSEIPIGMMSDMEEVPSNEVPPEVMALMNAMGAAMEIANNNPNVRVRGRVLRSTLNQAPNATLPQTSSSAPSPTPSPSPKLNIYDAGKRIFSYDAAKWIFSGAFVFLAGSILWRIAHRLV